MKSTVVISFMLGGISGLFFRDELVFPTNMRIKVAVLEYHAITRKSLDTDLLDIIDPSSGKELLKKKQEIEEEYERSTEDK